ncbi:M23 family metallopeptidase [Paenibacillus sabinae]|uniref:Peptidase M23 n=1 Tax=Paenibacillus sabinae T27 TaxID=1268072 RepID=X5A6G0_9BACL|nr:M23 family metallopeptidase [Paenibacillus sabinae]AHV99379.1 peptidase M23 [Paenibacillus sabinae T27]
MNEQNKNKPSHEESLKTNQGETSSQPSSWNRLFSKRWVFPAVYTAAAAIILTLVWVYQDAGHKPLSTDTAAVVTKDVGASGDTTADAGKDPNALEVTASAESLAWPVANPSDVDVVKPYYDENGTEENHIEAMVQNGDTFTPNTGIDLAREDNKTFDVKSAISGEVTRVEDVPTLGTVVEVTQGNLKTVYQSLGEAKVKQGDQVKQGDTLAAAGRNEIEKNLGNHLHFEVYQDGKVVNPSDLLPQK